MSKTDVESRVTYSENGEIQIQQIIVRLNVTVCESLQAGIFHLADMRNINYLSTIRGNNNISSSTQTY